MTIETAFQKLEKYLNFEISSLGYPKAALFGFCMALVAFNIYVAAMISIQAAYPDKDIHDEISDDYIAEEITTIFNDMNLMLEDEIWVPFVTYHHSELICTLLEMAGHIELRKLKKHKRGAKKPPPPKNEHKGKPHVSTAKLLS